MEPKGSLYGITQVKIVVGLSRSLFQEKKFQPGGATFHGMMASHGVDAEWYEYNRTVELVPKRVGEGSMVSYVERYFCSCHMCA